MRTTVRAGLAAVLAAGIAATGLFTGAVHVYGLDAHSLNYGVTASGYGFEIQGVDGPGWFHCGRNVGPIPGTDC